MYDRLAADALLLAHFAFVAFVALGGTLLLRWPKLAWVHVPAALWGALVELFGWVCPLTPLEVALRRSAGDAGYSGGFIEHYLVAVLYPQSLTRDIQFELGMAVVVMNVALYGIVIRRARMRQRA